MGFETLGKRTVVTVLFGPFILFCAWKGGYLFLALISSIVVLGIHEFYELATRKVTSPQRAVGMAAGLVICVLMYLSRPEDIWILLAVVLLVLLVLELFRNEVGPILNVATTILGLLYGGFLVSFLVLIRQASQKMNLSYETCGEMVILIFMCVWLCDTSAYLLGSRIGRHKLFERVSPNKTVEGTVAGFLFALLTAYLCHLSFLQEIKLHHALIIGGICGSIGQVSDLLESLFKRDAGVKDSSNLIPGHGG
ncbi:phosphatidate cytidylyltransferase, partial [bacterium]|nr:phosphatidate cytidylyltransferase [bacterium]